MFWRFLFSLPLSAIVLSFKSCAGTFPARRPAPKCWRKSRPRRSGRRGSKGREKSLPLVVVQGAKALGQVSKGREGSLAYHRSSHAEDRVQRAARPGHGLVMMKTRRSGDAGGFAGQARCYRLGMVQYRDPPRAWGMQRGAALAPPCQDSAGTPRTSCIQP